VKKKPPAAVRAEKKTKTKRAATIKKKTPNSQKPNEKKQNHPTLFLSRFIFFRVAN